MCNHSSYLDISVLGDHSRLLRGKGRGCSLAVLRFSSQAARTVFVDRRRHTSHRQRDQLRGTVACRRQSHPVSRREPRTTAIASCRSRSSAQRRRDADGNGSLATQPVSIAYVDMNGLPIGRGLRPMVAWYGGMSLGPHLWQFNSPSQSDCRLSCTGPHRRFCIAQRNSTRHCNQSVAGVSNAPWPVVHPHLVR